MGGVEVLIGVTVVASPQSRQHDIRTLQLPAGNTVADAIAASGLLDRHPVLRELADAGNLRAGVWGRLSSLDAPLADGDRVELWRPLVVDPKEARRVRYRAQGERGRQSRPRRKPVAPALPEPIPQD
jgi:putative ubiquitin-RnfH superfamily antitoxin RatB of RatAB toxin-antitoxin module